MSQNGVEMTRSCCRLYQTTSQPLRSSRTSIRITPGDTVLQNIMADALAYQPEAPRLAPKQDPKRQWLSGFADFLGWRAAGALSLCLALGFGLGLNFPESIQDLGVLYGLEAGATSEEDLFFLDDFWGES